MKLFLDSSAFAKRYVTESGSKKVLELCQQADRLVVSVICLPEYISTISRLLREKKFSQWDYRKLKENAMEDLADADLCQITQEVLTLTISVLESNTVRAMDALHVACAIVVEPDVFVSGDHRQLAAAKKAGFKVIDVS